MCSPTWGTMSASIAVFFFSSRRRHTRSYGDWSSDVCSSDLREAERFRLRLVTTRELAVAVELRVGGASFAAVTQIDDHRVPVAAGNLDGETGEIGRASCRERG